MMDNCRSHFLQVSLLIAFVGILLYVSYKQEVSPHFRYDKADSYVLCNGTDTAKEGQKIYHAIKQYSEIEAEDGYVVISLYDKEGNEVYSGEYVANRVWIDEVAENILIIRYSTGTDASYDLYFNKETLSIVLYENAILINNKYVAYMKDKKTLVITDIFEEGILYREIVRDFSTVLTYSGIQDVQIVDGEYMEIEYLRGEECESVIERFFIGCGIDNKQSVSYETVQYSNHFGTNDIEINYPQLQNAKEINQQNINDLIEKDVKRILENNQLYEENNYCLKLKCEVTYFGNNIISIYYTGFDGPGVLAKNYYEIALGTTIDMKKEKVLHLEDIITDFDEMAELLAEDKFQEITIWADEEPNKFSKHFQGKDKNILINELQTYDSGYIENVEWYTDGNDIVIIYGNLTERYYEEYAGSKELLEEITNPQFWEMLAEDD